MKKRFLRLKNKLRRIATHCYRVLFRRKYVPIIVSLTTYPARINTVHIAIQSLLAQKVLPDKVIIWLCKSDFPNLEADLPAHLRRQLGFDVQIAWIDDDLKPHKKYFWVLQQYPNANIVIVDDDLIYRNTMIEDLLKYHHRYPDAVIASRTHYITFDNNGHANPYDQWIYEAPHYNKQLVGKPSFQLFATNGAGTLYPPLVTKKITPMLCDKDFITRYCLTADDLWLKIAQLYSNIKVVAATSDQLLNYVPNTQGEEALCHVNTEQGANTVILANILSHLDANHTQSWFDTMVYDPIR